MLTKFKKGKTYTLCLVTATAQDDVHTFCVNVIYQGQKCGVHEFKCCEYTYIVDIDLRSCTENAEIPVFESDVIAVPGITNEHDEIVGFVNETRTYGLCNIVQGWQW